MKMYLAAAMVVAPAFSAVAQVSFTAQTRSVAASGPGGGANSSASASDFGSFDRVVSSTGPAGGTASASQNSTLDPLTISAAGTANRGKNSFGAFGSASSQFQVAFTASSTQTFALSGTFDFASGSVVGPGVNISFSGSTGNVNQSGTFQAGGLYTFIVTTTGGVPGGQAVTGNYNLELAITGIVGVPVGTSFVYQGVVRKDGVAVNGPSDLEFALFPAASGAFQIGPTITANAVPVSNGLFSRRLDFGAVFEGNEKWLEVRVRTPAGSGAFEVIAPRTRLDATPYAQVAASSLTSNAAPWAGITGVPANVSEAFSPWQPIFKGIQYPNGYVVVGDADPELALTVDGGLEIRTGSSLLAFGKRGNLLGTADNTDFIGFQRETLESGAVNRSELRLYLGDDNQLFSNSLDFFTIGTIPGGAWTPTFGFRSDGFASKPGGGSWGNISDPRSKHGATPLTGTLDRLLSLRGYQYFYNDDEVKKGRALPGLQIGLMADEVERVFPDWVTRDRDGMLMVTERATTALMVEALRDLRREKDEAATEARSEIEKLKAENAAMRQRLERLEEALRK